MTRIGLPKETTLGEERVALVPESVKRLAAAGASVRVEPGAGAGAHFSDADYAEAGATVADDAATVYTGAQLIVKVRAPSPDEVALMEHGQVLIGLLQPGVRTDLPQLLADRGVTGLALELVPRITRAQAMDVLSSQSTVAGYKAVLVGAGALGKFLPMLTTAAASIAPARVFIIGAGVAGLQAIATARRLGGIVSAFDVRAAAREQVQSLGATFVAAELVSAGAEDRGGYAKAQSGDERERTLAAIGAHVPTQDLVITTALVPRQRAPLLITAAMVEQMRSGSVIVDLAADAGGNCEVTKPGETVTFNGVTIAGPVNLPATLPIHASQMFSKNVQTLLQHLIKDGELRLDLEDEITRAMVVAHQGQVALGG